jgi:DNA polymerase-3 subunit gamma/tau
MAYQVLARKYRPQRFSDVIGQDHVTHTLQNAIEQGRIAHGYIFSGHRGIGKTTIARILAMALNCRSKDRPVAEPCGVCESCTEIRAGNSVDVIEIDAATNRGIDEVRELREAARYRPARDRFKIWILDEAHQITDAAFNALLKTLEEPPAHVIFMMATTQPEDIPQTIRSRCQHFSFHAVRFTDIVQQLSDIAKQEGIDADTNALAMLAEVGDGSMRDALSIMDQAIACCGQKLTGDLVRGLVGAVPSEILEEMLNAVARNSSEEVLRQVDRLLTEGHNPAHFARQMLRFLRNALVAKIGGPDSPLLQISDDERARVGRVAEQFSEEDLARFLQIMLRTHSDLGYKQEQRFHLELGLLKLVHAQRLLPLEQLLSDSVPAGGAPPVTGRSESPASRVTTPVMTSREMARSAASSTTSAPRPSPFESDRSRKTTSGPAWDDPRTPKAEAVSPSSMAVAVEAPPEPPPAQTPVTESDIQNAVLQAMEKAGARAPVLSIEVRGADLNVQLDVPQSVLAMALSQDAQRQITAAAGQVVGRPLKLKLLPKPANGTPAANLAPRPSGPGAKTRATEEPVVKRMQEKFGAKILRVIDQGDKR